MTTFIQLTIEKVLVQNFVIFIQMRHLVYFSKKSFLDNLVYSNYVFESELTLKFMAKGFKLNFVLK